MTVHRRKLTIGGGGGPQTPSHCHGISQLAVLEETSKNALISRSIQSTKLFLQSSELGLTPSPAGKCSLPPLVPGGGAHSLAGEGVGESQFRRGDICTLRLLSLKLINLCAAEKEEQIQAECQVPGQQKFPLQVTQHCIVLYCKLYTDKSLQAHPS
jgi:hypothetical protein